MRTSVSVYVCMTECCHRFENGFPTTTPTTARTAAFVCRLIVQKWRATADERHSRFYHIYAGRTVAAKLAWRGRGCIERNKKEEE